jgi:hypothetical protein
MLTSICVHDAVHTAFAGLASMRAVIVILSTKAAHARPTPGATALPFAMSRKRIATSELAVTLGTYMRTFTGVQFSMTLEIVKSAEAHITGLADVWLLLTVRQQVTLEIMMTREFCLTVGTFVFLLRGRPGSELLIET